jgi:hypothetical protein
LLVPVGEIQNPEKSSERKELEEKRARRNKKKEMGSPFPSAFLLSPLHNPVQPVQTKLKNRGCLLYVARKTQTPSVHRTKPSSHASLSLVHLPEVNAKGEEVSVARRREIMFPLREGGK